MAVLIDRFQKIHGDATKQIGRYFCIPATLCNALRLFGVADCTQERIRDEWYTENRKTVEPSIDDQMEDAGFVIRETMERRMDCMNDVHKSCFSLSGDKDPIDLSKADLALEFVENHINTDHPVIVSTWNRVYNGDTIKIQGYHMWLLLDFDKAANTAVYHDSGTDLVTKIPITSCEPVILKGKNYQLDKGLKGCITHSDYSCLALWKDPA